MNAILRRWGRRALVLAAADMTATACLLAGTYAMLLVFRWLYGQPYSTLSDAQVVGGALLTFGGSGAFFFMAAARLVGPTLRAAWRESA